MPNTREKLVELLKDDRCPLLWMQGDVENLADYLIANGVTLANQLASTSKQLASSGWIPVTERLPDKHDRYLCNVKAFSFPDLRYFAILKYDDGGFIEGKIYTDDVTHWMPLPEPPKTQ